MTISIKILVISPLQIVLSCKPALFSFGDSTGKGQFSFQSQRKAMPKNAQTTTQLRSSHTLSRRRRWHPTPVLLPGKSHEWRILVGCSPWGRDFTFTFAFHFHALEKEMATHSSVLAWRIPGTGESDGLPSMGSHRVGHDWSDLAAAAAAAELLLIAVSSQKIT